ncbi:nickel ABC transporter, substrate-binding protein [Escherichia coli]|uniref:Nickel ABC transporter, substrate-binding protein n=1 Tax=Escherichia coli TaxID=562 RepID=A0A377AQ98_ECOLX|nr:nickel ABC transporter, substrate-binding protein [Escherichia coli]
MDAACGKDIREKNGQPLRIELSFIGTDALSKSMAEIIQADMRQIGADVSLIGEKRAVSMLVSATVVLA